MGSIGRNSKSSSGDSTPQGRVASPFSSQQAQDLFTSPESVRLSFAVHRDEPLPPRNNSGGISTTHAKHSRYDEEQVLRQLSEGHTLNSPHAAQSAQHEDAQVSRPPAQRISADINSSGRNVQHNPQKVFNLSPRDLQPPRPSPERAGQEAQLSYALSSLPEQPSDSYASNDRRHMFSSDDATSANSLLEENATLPPSALFTSPRTAPRDSSIAQLRTPHSPLHSDDSSPAPTDRIVIPPASPPSTIDQPPIDQSHSFALSSVAFPSHQQSFADSVIEGEPSYARLSITPETSVLIDDMHCDTAVAPLSKIHVPHAQGSGISITRTPEGGLRVPDATRTEGARKSPAAQLGAFGSGASEAERISSQGNLLMPQGSGRLDASTVSNIGSMATGGTATGSHNKGASIPRTYSSGAPKTPMVTATPHAFASAGSAAFGGRMSGDLGEAQRLLARSGTQPMLMFPDTPEGYYAEITCVLVQLLSLH